VFQIGFSTSTNVPGVFLISCLFFSHVKQNSGLLFCWKTVEQWGPPVGLASAARRLEIDRRGWRLPVTVRTDIKGAWFRQWLSKCHRHPLPVRRRRAATFLTPPAAAHPSSAACKSSSLRRIPVAEACIATFVFLGPPTWSCAEP
jgi:hypothetical protein